MSTLKNRNIIGKQDLLLVSLNKFYKKGNNKELLLSIINSNKVSLRIIDWFVTNYCKKNNIKYVIRKQVSPKNTQKKMKKKISKKDNDLLKQINIFLSYKSQLRAYSKKQFDPFCRRNRIKFYFYENDDEFIITTVGQLNFFKWAIENNIIKYIIDNYKEIEIDMNLNSRNKQNIDNKTKIRKKRTPLSISASKNMNKDKFHTVLKFE